MNIDILIVDDDYLTILYMKEMLMVLGCEVQCANSAQMALEILTKNQIDLIISDVNMPETDGLEFFLQIQKLHPLLADNFILISSNVCEEQMKEIKELQLSLYQKPLSLVTLTKIVAKNFGSDLLEGSKSKFNKL
ncbi:response regulator [Candidatus Uabimicrobium amorphum]|uniref:Histidine kinase n=1 Tax=Uabimicrobium amorphum TaxID=2596890 RepID=A0A5S9IKS1_UABAM|nr:response regulator [Candidatus Uabimicrobium amorphum]BBM82880.1 histidine kinase [Candidatus Uabimicrobium amorphum]